LSVSILQYHVQLAKKERGFETKILKSWTRSSSVARKIIFGKNFFSKINFGGICKLILILTWKIAAKARLRPYAIVTFVGEDNHRMLHVGSTGW